MLPTASERELYSPAFYNQQAEGSVLSASIVVPLILSIFNIKSVVDVGCGVGGWLREFSKNGVEDYLGIDGDYVQPQQLLIPSDRFEAQDLKSPNVKKRFDLACSLEVAEHLPESCADSFVSSLVKAAPIVMFSAAIKGQGGTNHINEQWQSYWARRFRSHGYKVIDCIRPTIFSDQRVERWYRQNILVYCKPNYCPTGFPVVSDDLDVDHVLSEYFFKYKVNGSVRITSQSGTEAAKAMMGNANVVLRQLIRRLGYSGQTSG